MDNLHRDFKGIWIPKEIWLDTKLSYFEKLLWAEIDSLDGENHCYASNEYFAKFFNAKEKTISEAISRLKKLGYVYLIGFDGRTRYLSTKTTQEKFEEAASGKNRRQNPEKTGGSSIASLAVRENKEDILKEKNSKKRKSKDESPSITFNSLTRRFEGITEEDINAWRKAHPSVNVLKVIDECAIWALSNPREHYRISLNTFMKNTELNHTTPWKPPSEPTKEVPIEDIQINKKLAEQWELIYNKKRIQNYDIQAKPSKVLFLFPNNHSEEIEYTTSTEEFKKKCHISLLKMKLEE